jgi:hypothetical protein
MPLVVGVWPWGWMSHSLAIVGLKWTRCMCCDYEACLVWVMPWVCVVWVDALCEVKSNEVLDFGCVWVIVNPCVYGNDGGCCVSGVDDGGGIVVVPCWFQLFAENGSVCMFNLYPVNASLCVRVVTVL